MFLSNGKMEMTKNTARYNILPQDVLKVFSAIFLDEGHCRQWIIDRLHPDGLRCPKCGHELTKKQSDFFVLGKRVMCQSCGKCFNVRTDTLLSCSHMTYSQIFLLAFLLGTNQPCDYIAKSIGCDEETVRLWKHKFKTLERVLRK
jgi:transposase-like protein